MRVRGSDRQIPRGCNASIGSGTATTEEFFQDLTWVLTDPQACSTEVQISRAVDGGPSVLKFTGITPSDQHFEDNEVFGTGGSSYVWTITLLGPDGVLGSTVTNTLNDLAFVT